MPLPKISHPLYDFEILSLNKKVKIRPFTVKEEKIILLSNTSDDPDDKLNAIIQIVNNCIVSETIDVDKLPSFDIERLFIKLREISVDSKVEVQWVDPNDNKKYPFTMDLSKIELDGYSKDLNVIQLTDEIGVVVSYPPLMDIPQIYKEFKDYETKSESITNIVDRFLGRYLQKIYDGDNVNVRGDDFNDEELKEFIDELHIAHAQQILDFFLTIPTTVYRTKIKKEDGEIQDIEIRGILNFLA